MKRNIHYSILASLLMAALLMGSCTKESPDVRLDAKLSTSQVVNVTWDSASVVGFVIAQGAGFSERGICYDTAAAPTVGKNKVIYSVADKKATFTVRLGGLKRLTQYYAKAYAINDEGVLYGEEVNFSTTAALPLLGEIIAPVLSVTSTKGVLARTAVTIPDDGGPDKTADIAARGVVFGLYPGPTVDTNKTVEGTGKNAFTSIASGLLGNRTYYLRAYASNKVGTSYSNEVSFITPISYGFVTTQPVQNLTKTSVTFKGVMTTDGGTAVIERGFVYGTVKNPKITDTKLIYLGTNDTLTADVTGLDTNKTYHVRAFITNEIGTTYGADVAFITLSDTSTIGMLDGELEINPAFQFLASFVSKEHSSRYPGFQQTDELLLVRNISAMPTSLPYSIESGEFIRPYTIQIQSTRKDIAQRMEKDFWIHSKQGIVIQRQA